MIQHGTRPVPLDRRDYSFHRTFPRAGGIALQPMIYSYDAGFGMPDQNADGLPMGCTGYAQSELCQDQDQKKYDARTTYDLTLKLENSTEGAGCDMRDSLSTLLDPGARSGDGYAPRTAYFRIDKKDGYDWFDSIRLALRTGFKEKQSVSITTPWFPAFESTNFTGIVPSDLHDDVAALPWHNHKLCGETLIDKDEYLVDKSWQGTSIGDHGWLYFGRATVNQLMAIRGSAAYTVSKAAPQDVQTVVLTKYELLYIVLRTIISLLTARRA